MKIESLLALRGLEKRLRRTGDGDFEIASEIIGHLERWSSMSTEQMRLHVGELSSQDIINIRGILGRIVEPITAHEPLSIDQEGSPTGRDIPSGNSPEPKTVPSPKVSETKDKSSTGVGQRAFEWDAQDFEYWADRFRMSKKALADGVGVDPEQVSRALSEGRPLPKSIAEKLDRLTRLWIAAERLFEGNRAVADYLTRTRWINDEPPLSAVKDQATTADLEGHLVGLAYGNFQ